MTAAPDMASAPLLTFPPEEAMVLRAAYAQATTILEYGSGGSTAMAAAMPSKKIFSVESDRKWVIALAAWFDRNPPASLPVLHHCDLGETKGWGYPATNQEWSRFHHYPLGVWDRTDFVHPEVVLIDGRFRTACYLTTLFRCRRPVTVFIDDYANRPAYHEIERYGAPAAIIGRMARFDVVPQELPIDELSFIMDQYARKA